MIAIISGLLAGLVHVFSGPDHLAAVAPLSVARKGGGALTGLRWGLGHGAGVIAVGVLSLLLRELLPLEMLSSWAERIVGVLLVGIGIWGLHRAFSKHVHAHEHVHDGIPHVHIHVHTAATAHSPRAAARHHHGHAAFGVGVLHGMAGSSHFWGVLPALAFPNSTLALLYLAAYAGGTVLGMVCFSSVIGMIAQRLSFSGTGAYRSLMAGASSMAVLVGAYWMVI